MREAFFFVGKYDEVGHEEKASGRGCQPLSDKQAAKLEEIKEVLG